MEHPIPTTSRIQQLEEALQESQAQALAGQFAAKDFCEEVLGIVLTLDLLKLGIGLGAKGIAHEIVAFAVAWEVEI